MGLFDDDNTMDIVGATREQTRLAREEARRAAWQAAITQKLAIDRDKIARDIEAAGRKYIRRRADVGMAPEDSYITKRSRFWNPGDLAGLRAGEDIYPLGSDIGAWNTELEGHRPAWWATGGAHPGSLAAQPLSDVQFIPWRDGVDPPRPEGDGWYWANGFFGSDNRWAHPDPATEWAYRTGNDPSMYGYDPAATSGGTGAYNSQAQPGMIGPDGRVIPHGAGSMLYPGGPDGVATTADAAPGDSPGSSGTAAPGGGGVGDGDGSPGVATRYKEPKRYQYDWSL